MSEHIAKPEGPEQEPKMSEPTHKLPESLPYQMMIGDIRRMLFMPYDCEWNGYIRDMTAELEQPGEYVNVSEAFSRINAKAAKMMGVLEFQKAMYVPATAAPSQPAREWRNSPAIFALRWKWANPNSGMSNEDREVALLELYAAQQSAAKDAEIRWRCFHCDEVFTTKEAAAEHFGPDRDEGWQAACVDPLTKDEKERRAELVAAHIELNAARDESISLQEQADAYHAHRAELIRYFGDSSPWLIHDRYDNMKFRAEAAERERDSLRDALRQILTALKGSDSNRFHCIEVAEKALTGWTGLNKPPSLPLPLIDPNPPAPPPPDRWDVPDPKGSK